MQTVAIHFVKYLSTKETFVDKMNQISSSSFTCESFIVYSEQEMLIKFSFA